MPIIPMDEVVVMLATGSCCARKILKASGYRATLKRRHTKVFQVRDRYRCILLLRHPTDWPTKSPGPSDVCVCVWPWWWWWRWWRHLQCAHRVRKSIQNSINTTVWFCSISRQWNIYIFPTTTICFIVNCFGGGTVIYNFCIRHAHDGPYPPRIYSEYIAVVDPIRYW